jgi:hypothetical protein|nr:MAG: hypothetical protein KatS3mg041_0161 [Bacteroidota bacterium]
MGVVLLLGALLLLWALLPSGRPPEPTAESWWRADSLAAPDRIPSGSGFAWDALLRVGLLIGLLFGVLYWLRRRQAQTAPARWARTEAAYPLPAGAHLVLVRVGEQWLLLGVTPHQVSLLAAYDSPPGGSGGTEQLEGFPLRP